MGNLSSPSSSSSSKQVVFIGSSGFSPKSLEIEVGVEIEFRLAYDVTSSEHLHRLTGASMTPELNFKSPMLQREEEFSFTPLVCGEITVYCPIYTAGIICKILVKASTYSNSHTATSPSWGWEKFQSVSASSQSSPLKKGEINLDGPQFSNSRDTIGSKAVYPSCTRLRVETFAFEHVTLSIKQGTMVEFISHELESDVVLACGWNHLPNEFAEFEDVVLSGDNSGSYFHIFATIGKFKVMNKNFSFMSCIIDVIFDMDYFDVKPTKPRTRWYPIFPSRVKEVDEMTLVRPHDLVAAKKSPSTKLDSEIRDRAKTMQIDTNQSKDSKIVELHQAVNFSQLSNCVSPTAHSEDVTSILESMSSTKDIFKQKNSQDSQEVVGDVDIETGGLPSQLSKSQKRKIRKKKK